MTDESINTGYIVADTNSGAKVALFTNERTVSAHGHPS